LFGDPRGHQAVQRRGSAVRDRVAAASTHEVQVDLGDAGY
jgi:hypothetical protein